MNRDLAGYEEQYLKQPYEKYQVAFRKRKLLELLQKYNHAIMLEVGCGLASLFLDIDTYRQLVVTEPSKIFYDKAVNDRKKQTGKDIVLLNAFLEDEKDRLKDYKFDFIIVSCLLHEIPDQSKFLQVIHGISNENTVIHFNVPNAKSFHRLLAVEMRLIKDEFQQSESNLLFQQKVIFDLSLLTETMHKNGFMVIESGSYSFKPFTHAQLQKMIDGGVITEQMLDGFYNMEKYLPGIGSEIFVNVRKVSDPVLNT